MKLKNILLAFACLIICIFTLALFGCNDGSSQGGYGGTTQDTFTVDTSIYPENYAEIQEKIFSVISSPKEKEDGKIVGSNCMKLLNEYDDFESPELLKKVKKETIKQVNAQVEGVKCTNVRLIVNPKDKTDGLFYVYFKYEKTGYEDLRIYNFDLT